MAFDDVMYVVVRRSAHRDARRASMGDDDSDDDGLARYRRALGVTRAATIADVRRAFVEVAKRAHPDAVMHRGEDEDDDDVGAARLALGTTVRTTVSFRDAVEAREALMRSMVMRTSSSSSSSVSSSYSRSSSFAFASGARTAGTAQTKAYALALAAPAAMVAAVVAFAFPSTKTYGSDSMGRVHGVMNAPVNPWLRPDAAATAAKSNEDRMWRRVFGGG